MIEIEKAKQDIAEGLIAMVETALSGGPRPMVSEIRATSVSFAGTTTHTLSATLEMPDGQLSITRTYRASEAA